ncbi:hypothetical protein [Thiocapsa rosea]|uniref:hypothetical protein n=1 Tax=Thiocapsa rosea TaxID=69360 RepID=UPI001475C83A|nr:hypothetical protein [Thiocapsa rosea]
MGDGIAASTRACSSAFYTEHTRIFRRVARLDAASARRVSTRAERTPLSEKPRALGLNRVQSQMLAFA